MNFFFSRCKYSKNYSKNIIFQNGRIKKHTVIRGGRWGCFHIFMTANFFGFAEKAEKPFP